jgi:hypothetical protein
MKIYRVHMRYDREHPDAGNSAGYKYYSNRKDALKAFARNVNDVPRDDDSDFHSFEVEISKGGILRALNTYGGHPDNG